MNQRQNKALEISSFISFARLSEKGLLDGLEAVMYANNLSIGDFDTQLFVELLKKHLIEDEIEKKICFPRTCFKWKVIIKKNI